MNENFGIISYEFDDTTIQVEHFLPIIIKSGLGRVREGVV